MNIWEEIRKKDGKLALLRQAFWYGVIGGSCAALDYGVFTLLAKVFSVNELVANPIGVVVGMICSFFLNYYFNFRATDRFGLRLASFLIVGTIGLGFSELIMYVGVTVLEKEQLLVKLISVFLVAALQFVLNKLITFKGV